MIADSEKESRRSMLKRIGLTSASLFTVIASGTLLWATRTPTREEIRMQFIMPISCDEVLVKLAAFHQRTLDDALTRRVNCHFHKCRHCRDKYLTCYTNAKLQPLSCRTLK